MGLLFRVFAPFVKEPKLHVQKTKNRKMLKTLDLNFMNTPECIAAFLLETAAGPVLFETGPHSTLPKLTENLAVYGYALEDVRHVFITHIHLDHAGAAWVFAERGAHIYLHPRGARHMQDPSRLLESARRIYQDRMDELWGTLKPIPEDQLVTVAHGEEIVIGGQTIAAWHTPGHAVHHIAWQIGDRLVTGDVGGVKMTGGVVEPPCPPPDIDLEAWMQSLDLIEALDAETFYLTHFGEVRETREHLAALRKVLISWSDWMRPYAEKGADWKLVIPGFEAFVARERHKLGVDESSQKKYDNANPTWMSVAGLMRYWRKKLAID